MESKNWHSDATGWEPGDVPQAVAPFPMTITKMPELKESARQKLFRNHKDICEKALQLMYEKNNDYANDGDPFLNFREFGKFGIAVRMGDKWRRFKHFAERGQKGMAVNESMEDTLLDLINYAILYLSYEEK